MYHVVFERKSLVFIFETTATTTASSATTTATTTTTEAKRTTSHAWPIVHSTCHLIQTQKPSIHLSHTLSAPLFHWIIER